MKTAMQELIQELIESKERGETIVNYDLFCAEFLEKEKDFAIDFASWVIKGNINQLIKEPKILIETYIDSNQAGI
jgi:hypothetical protein